MDCIIYAPRTEAGRAELARFVHRPILKHALYTGPDYSNYDSGISGSFSLDSLKAVIGSLEIEDDPYIKKLRKQLENARTGSDRTRMDQKLSKALNKKDTYTFKGLADFFRASEAICYDVGTWAANLYVHEVKQLATKSFSPYEPVIINWDTEERSHMVGILSRVDASEPAPEDMMVGLSDKVRALAECLRAEYQEVTARDEVFKGIVFVTRRDTTVALTRVLKTHPLTKDYFTVDCILGNSRNAYRRSFMDLTQGLLKRSTSDTLAEFAHGDINLLIATSVAEEGIDIRVRKINQSIKDALTFGA
jgi:endoribonuclease Dicer